MSEDSKVLLEDHPPPRVLVGAVMHPRSRTLEEIAKAVVEEVKEEGFKLVRSVVVSPESEVVRQLVTRVSNDNEADAIILLGGTGFGPYDNVSEAVQGVVERRIEGFGEAVRAILREQEDFRSVAWLMRAVAGVYNQCLVFALTGRLNDVKRVVSTLVMPALPDAVLLATGKIRARQLRTPQAVPVRTT
jgi:molybdopterin adenylyltransferase